jgi:hypothetical protein
MNSRYVAITNSSKLSPIFSNEINRILFTRKLTKLEDMFFGIRQQLHNELCSVVFRLPTREIYNENVQNLYTTLSYSGSSAHENGYKLITK